MPHCAPLCCVVRKHAPLAVQHPSAQLVASHTHWPAEQRWPTAHAGPLPHSH
jgi:hypothetical protein